MTVRGLLVAAVLSAQVALLAGCGSASQPSPPAGVDRLVVPTPSPDPDDFVAAVDNPWLPLEVGRTWHYRVADTGGVHPLVVTVSPGPTVAGVPTTAVTSREEGREVVDWYAQDQAGNVWWFGRDGSWQAGTDGAQAGLAMAATPRIGDGYRTAYLPGTVEDTATVLAVDDESIVVRQRSGLRPGEEVELTYERGTGLVSGAEALGSYRVLQLVR
jgi:hypothetical protein